MTDDFEYSKDDGVYYADCDYQCLKCRLLFTSSEEDEGTVLWEIATCPDCGGLAYATNQEANMDSLDYLLIKATTMSKPKRGTNVVNRPTKMYCYECKRWLPQYQFAKSIWMRRGYESFCQYCLGRQEKLK